MTTHELAELLLRPLEKKVDDHETRLRVVEAAAIRFGVYAGGASLLGGVLTALLVRFLMKG